MPSIESSLIGLPVLVASERASGGAVRGTSSPATFKNRDVEELVDFWVHRPLAARLVRVLSHRSITPNQVTALSGIVGVIGGIVIGASPADGSWQVPLGGLLLFVSIILDCADGQLARLTGQSSMVGRMLDGTVDVFPTAAAFIGFAASSCRFGYDPRFVYALAFAAGVSMKWHVHAYDHAKNVYLANVLAPGERATSLPTYEEIMRERDAHAERGDWFGALVLSGFLRFTRSQRRGWQGSRIGMGAQELVTNEERRLYRESFRKTMRLWTFQGLGTHLSILVLAAFATPLFRDAPIVVWLFMAGPMNLFNGYLLYTERRIEGRLLVSLRATRPLETMGIGFGYQ